MFARLRRFQAGWDRIPVRHARIHRARCKKFPPGSRGGTRICSPPQVHTGFPRQRNAQTDRKTGLRRNNFRPDECNIRQSCIFDPLNNNLTRRIEFVRLCICRVCRGRWQRPESRLPEQSKVR